VAVFGPLFAPYGPFDRVYDATGRLMQLQPPSASHWLGTTVSGRDVLSQMLWGARPALIIGFATAFGVASIGVNVGLIAGYFGGRVDSVMMRVTAHHVAVSRTRYKVPGPLPEADALRGRRTYNRSKRLDNLVS
jgi:ABC-type dipeptide/oligopeptide/nickel transport system permease subunit